MGPDPEKIHRDNNFDQADYVVNQVDDEMDIDEQQNNDGYFMMNNDNDFEHYMPANDDTDSEEEDEENEYFPQASEQAESPIITPDVPQIRSSSTEIIAAVWNNTNSSSTIEITNEKSEQITQIMSKITLPNAPAWLNEINSENILDRIKNKNRETNSEVNKN